MAKCTCKRIAPRCEYCLEDKRRRNKESYTTEKRREREARYRERKFHGVIAHDPLDVAYANRILAKKPPSSAITWLELSAGRSNS